MEERGRFESKKSEETWWYSLHVFKAKTLETNRINSIQQSLYIDIHERFLRQVSFIPRSWTRVMGYIIDKS